jgi:predicted MFS family arabinose efflux permease
MEDEAGRDLNSSLSRAEWLLLLVLAAVQFSHSMDFMVMMPLGPQCRDEMGITPQQFNLVVGAYGLTAALAGFLATWFIDRFDRKAALLTLYAGLTVGTFLCAVAPGYWWLVLARAVAGGFGGIGASFILVIIGDAFPEIRRGRATGVVMTAFSLASIAGIPVGVLLGNRFGAQTPFGILAAFCAIVLIVAIKVLPRMRGHLKQRRQSAGEIWTTLTQPVHLRAYLFVIMLVMGTFTIAPNFSDFLVHNVGRDKDDLAYVYFAGGLLTFVTLPLVGRLADRFGKRIMFRLMAVGTLLTLLAMTNLPPLPLFQTLVVTTLYFIVTSGRWVPAMAMVTSSALPRYRGSFMSVNASLQQLAIFLATMIAGIVIDEAPDGRLTGYGVAGLIAAASTAASIFLAGWIRAPEEAAEASQAVDFPEGSSLISAGREPCGQIEH